MASNQTLTINDIEFEVGPCLHCNMSASELEAMKALAAWSEWLGERLSCAVCGDLIKMVKVTLEHKVVGRDPGATTWKVRFVTFNDCVNLMGFGGTPVRIHGGCGRIAMPHADWASLDGTSHTEEGRGSIPWDSLITRERPHGA